MGSLDLWERESLDGQTEEQIRAESAAESRHLVDIFIEVVKTEVPDPAIRDRVARVLLERLPTPSDDQHDALSA